MRTVDVRQIQAPPDDVFEAARDVERWPALLAHYRRVRVLDRHAGRVVVEMAAWRPFGALRWPTWWVSEMWTDPARREVRYRHVRGVTTGMDVTWSVTAAAGGATATIVHEWAGPPWPLIGRATAEWIIGPVFVHGIASRTLAGLARHLEQRHA